MKNIEISIVYALPEKQYFKRLIVEKGTTVKQAIFLSKIINDIKTLNIKKHKIGIYGVLIKYSHILEKGDRIEIYRNLILDPQDLRRNKLQTI